MQNQFQVLLSMDCDTFQPGHCDLMFFSAETYNKEWVENTFDKNTTRQKLIWLVFYGLKKLDILELVARSLKK
jgi:hypothetical protein